MLKKSWSVVLLFLIYVQVAQAKVIYVSFNAVGTSDGTSWINAFTSIHSAISVAIFGDSIWVASGIYKPSATDRNISFNLKNGTHLFGGFAGTETSLSQRNPLLNITTLSGDIGTGGVNTDNTYHIITAYNLNFTTTIDGFRIMDGNASTGHPYGAGIDMDEAKLVVRNCSFLNNTTVADGAAIYQWNESLLVENCSFLYNRSSGSGAAISCNVGTTRIINSVFTGNESTAGGGGAIENSGEDLFIDRCVFSGNSCDASGAAVLSTGISHKDTIINSIFVGNVSYWGSVVEINITSNINGDASIAIINCTVAHNNSLCSTSSSSYDAALSVNCGSSPEVVYNTIVWGNRSQGAVQGTASSNVFNCITDQSTLSSNGCLVTNPLFANPAASASQAPFVLPAYDYHLLSNSPAVDNGFSSYPWLPYTLDVDSVQRPYGIRTDIGAYEKAYCTFSPEIIITGDSVFCNGQSATLSAPPGLSYTWNNNTISQSIQVNSSGTYSLFMIDSAYCRGNASKVITVTTATVPVNVVGTDTFCNGSSAQLVAQVSGNFLWNNGATTGTLIVSNSGLYSVTVTDSVGCISTGSRTVYKSSPSVNVTGQNFFCSGNSTTLTANSAAGNSFLWNTGSQSGALSVNQAGSYTVTVTAPGNCTATASYSVSEQPTVTPSVSVSVTNNGVCQGEPITFQASPMNGGTVPSYIWRKNGVSTGFSGNPYVSSTLNDGDNITVQMTSGASCASPAVVVSPVVTASVIANPSQPVITQNGNLLASSAASGNQWYLGGVQIPGATSNTLLATTTGFYTVEVTNAAGCKSIPSSATFVDLTGIFDEQFDVHLQLFPNPVVSKLFVQSDNQVLSLEIYSTTGILMAFFENRDTIDMQQMTSGVYLLRITTAKGSSFRKIIKV